MKSWEFLIQQEGDRAWHPIDTHSLEITAGKYRIMAHTHRTNADIDVRIVWQTHEAIETRHHSQQMTRRTNEEGLVMILPFSELHPGIWEIRCCNDIFSELLGQVWQEKLSLHVLSAPAALPLTLKREMSQENRTNMNQSASDAQYYLKQLEQLLRQEIEPKLNDPPSDMTPDNSTPPPEAEATADEACCEAVPELDRTFLSGKLHRESSTAIAPCPATVTRQVASQAKSVNYTIELFSTEADASYTFDFQVTEIKADSALPIVLPQPSQSLPMSRTASGQVLPPKLNRATAFPKKTKKSLKLPQFAAQNNSPEQPSPPSASQPAQSRFLEDRFLASLNQLN